MEKATHLEKFLKDIEKGQKKQHRNLQNIFDKYDDKKKRVPIPLGLIKEVLIRSGGICENCGIGLDELKPDIHHKNHDPSDNIIENLIVLCPNCHRKAHNNNPQNKKINITSKETRAVKTLNKLIDEKNIYASSKKALKEIVQEFFSKDYQGISKEQMEKMKRDFELRFLTTVISRTMKTERNEIDNLYDQMQTSLDLILDKSVDESRSEKGSVMKKIGDSVILQPNIHGVGIDLKKLFK